MTRTITRGATVALAIALLSASVNRSDAQSMTFQFDEPIELGSNLDRIGDLEWSETLGIDWNTGFSLGGIIGHQDATIIPEVRLFDAVIIPRISADTRTGARISGNVSGGTGLEFYASFNASGLESGAAFDFRPTIVDLPTQVSSGEFLKLQTNPGVVNNAAFTESLVDLPSFEAGMDFYFNLALDSKIEYGLFPFIGYNSVSFQPAINVDQSLVKFGFDLDPKNNGGVGTPPNLVILEDTPFEQRLGLLGDGESVYEKQISVEMSVEGEPITRRLDIGSVQLVNPFGTGESILGPEERNLTITTAIDQSSIKYSYETAILRLGLDLDGIAAYLGSAALTGAGHSFTRIEEKFADDQIELTLDLIDVKYGPEIGFRETVEIKPDFEVTVSFDREVALKEGNSITLADSFTGRWSDLPEIALLGEDPVEVSVSFDQLTGQQTKRSVFYLTDYLEFTVLELEELKFFDTLSISAPPLFQTRTSLLGSLLGEVELPLTDQTAAIAPFEIDAGLMGSSSFTLTPTPSTKVYLAASGGDFSTSPGAWRELATHTAPASLANAVLVIGTGDSSAALESDLEPVTHVDPGLGGFLHINVAGLVIPEGSTLEQRGSRDWLLTRIVNDGLYQFEGNEVHFNSLLVLAIGGQGEMRFEGTAMEILAPFLSNGLGHTLSVAGARGSIFADNFDNAGQIAFANSIITQIGVEERFNNSGSLVITSGGDDNHLTTPQLANDGLVEVSGSSTALRVRHPETFGQINIQSSSGTGQFIARDGATMQFTHTVLLATPGVNPQPVRFEAVDGATIRFDGPIRAFDAGVAELSVDETSTMILNGVEVRREDGKVSLVNKGLVEVMSGANRFYFDPIIPFGPGEEPRIVGINLDNQGTIRIRRNASLGFKAEIVDYVPGGATFGPGTWEIIGDVPPEPFVNSGQNVFIPGVFQARLEIDIAYIANEDTYLGRIDFGDTTGDGVPDGYSAEDYDTSLAVSEANVLLSGAARFDYFNTIRENRGSFTLRNRNHFSTDGDLLNSGAIRVESESRLNVSGDFTVDEGTVFLDNTSTWAVNGNTIEVIGGSVTVQRGAEPLFVDSSWIVREKWVGVDEQGNDIVREARVSYGDAWFPTIGPNADILVEGKQAIFEPLSGLNRIDGKLTLAGGNELHLAQSLNNRGTLRLDTAGKVYVDGELTTSGLLAIGQDTYLDVTGGVTATAGGSIELDGVVHAPDVIAKFATVLSGTGRLTGSLEFSGTLLADITGSDSDENELFVDGQTAFGGDLQVTLDGYIPTPADTISILHAAGGLAGAFNNIATGQRLDTMDGIGSFLVHYGIGSTFDPNQIILTAFEPTGDFNGDGNIDAADFVVWRKLDGSQQGYNAWRSNFGRTAGSGAAGSRNAHGVPEPSCFILLLTVLLTTDYRRRSRLAFARTSCADSA